MFGGAARESSPEFIDDLRRSGAPEEVIRDYENRARDDNDFFIHGDNWDAVRLFQASLTQWRYAGMAGVRVGLDYGAVSVVARAKGIKMAAETFEGLQILEAESLRIFSERD